MKLRCSAFLFDLDGVLVDSYDAHFQSWRGVYGELGLGYSEAAFAAQAGTSPIPASSGQTRRYRLNRRGHRQLNHALHTIAIVRMRDDP